MDRGKFAINWMNFQREIREKVADLPVLEGTVFRGRRLPNPASSVGLIYFYDRADF